MTDTELNDRLKKAGDLLKRSEKLKEDIKKSPFTYSMIALYMGKHTNTIQNYLSKPTEDKLDKLEQTFNAMESNPEVVATAEKLNKK